MSEEHIDSNLCILLKFTQPFVFQVLLNKEIVDTTDPVLLPEPSHVTLEHLYAQSIRDNMLVLSSTTRFKKKCITTILYRPI